MIPQAETVIPRSKWPMVSGRVVGVYGLEIGLPSGPSISMVKQLW